MGAGAFDLLSDFDSVNLRILLRKGGYNFSFRMMVKISPECKENAIEKSPETISNLGTLAI